MMKPFPAEHDLIALFESEPVLRDSDVPWSYNLLSFERAIGDEKIACEIHPGYERLKVRCFRRGAEFVNLDLHWVSGLVVECNGGVEALTAQFRDGSGLLSLRIQVSPSIHISWGTTKDLV